MLHQDTSGPALSWPFPTPTTLGKQARAARLAAGLDRLMDLQFEMIRKLDDLDGDPDLEPGGDEEPEHGASEVGNFRRQCDVDQSMWAANGNDDGREPSEDPEPSLGSDSPAYPNDQRRWANGGSDDREGPDGDPREEDEDFEHSLGRSEGVNQTQTEFPNDEREPSLGSLNGLDQRRWADDESEWRFQDMEEQCEDEGGACEDEGAQSGDDEPSLGAHETPAGTSQFYGNAADDLEPSLGSLGHIDQRMWSDHFTDAAKVNASFDFEEQSEDEGEPQHGIVPSYGIDQRVMQGAGVP
jgi:hypothetical protein